MTGVNAKNADPEWEWYIGKLYSKLIGSFVQDPIYNVVELGPGFRYKIANALGNIGFAGTLYVIDSCKEALTYVEHKYKKFIPNANIICINKNFEDAFNDLPNDIDLFTVNHCVDDMIMAEYQKETYTKALQNDTQDELISLWKKLNDDKETVKRISQTITQRFASFFKAKNVRNVIIGQYKSNLYFRGKSNIADTIAQNCFKEIKKLVNTNDEKTNEALAFFPFGEDDERYNYPELLNNTQNAVNWIVGKPCVLN